VITKEDLENIQKKMTGEAEETCVHTAQNNKAHLLKVRQTATESYEEIILSRSEEKIKQRLPNFKEIKCKQRLYINFLSKLVRTTDTGKQEHYLILSTNENPQKSAGKQEKDLFGIKGKVLSLRNNNQEWKKDIWFTNYSAEYVVALINYVLIHLREFSFAICLDMMFNKSKDETHLEMLDHCRVVTEIIEKNDKNILGILGLINFSNVINDLCDFFRYLLLVDSTFDKVKEFICMVKTGVVVTQSVEQTKEMHRSVEYLLNLMETTRKKWEIMLKKNKQCLSRLVCGNYVQFLKVALDVFQLLIFSEVIYILKSDIGCSLIYGCKKNALEKLLNVFHQTDYHLRCKDTTAEILNALKTPKMILMKNPGKTTIMQNIHIFNHNFIECDLDKSHTAEDYFILLKKNQEVVNFSQVLMKSFDEEEKYMKNKGKMGYITTKGLSLVNVSQAIMTIKDYKGFILEGKESYFDRLLLLLLFAILKDISNLGLYLKNMGENLRMLSDDDIIQYFLSLGIVVRSNTKAINASSEEIIGPEEHVGLKKQQNMNKNPIKDLSHNPVDVVRFFLKNDKTLSELNDVDSFINTSLNLSAQKVEKTVIKFLILGYMMDIALSEKGEREYNDHLIGRNNEIEDENILKSKKKIDLAKNYLKNLSGDELQEFLLRNLYCK
jgi:hypothetical protein